MGEDKEEGDGPNKDDIVVEDVDMAVGENDGKYRKSKRQRIVPPVLKYFQLDRRNLGLAKESFPLIFGSDPKVNYAAKFAQIHEQLKTSW